MPDDTRNNQVVFTLTTPAHYPSIFQDQELPVYDNRGRGRFKGDCSFVPPLV